MTEKVEQRICIKFCFKLEKTCAETIEMLQKAFEDECMGKTQIKEWYKRFKNGRTSVDSDSRSGRLTSVAQLRRTFTAKVLVGDRMTGGVTRNVTEMRLHAAALKGGT
ncbi:GVQW3 protein, partial [Acromyrmex heyeri]